MTADTKKKIISGILCSFLILGLVFPLGNESFWTLNSRAESITKRVLIEWNGTVNVDDDTNIPAGTELHIAPGTIVEMAYSAELYIHGTITVAGTDAEPVIFRSATPPDRWGSIHVYHDSVNSVFRNATIKEGQYGIRGQNAEFEVYDLTITNCKYGIGAVQGSDIYIENTNIDNSMFFSVYGEGSEVTFYNCTIGSNGEDDMHLDQHVGNGCVINFINGNYNFNSLSIQDANTEVNRCWSMDIQITEGGDGSPIHGAGVTIQRSNYQEAFSGSTGTDGRIRGIVLTQIQYKEVGPITFNPFIFTIEMNGFGTNVSTITIEDFTKITIPLYPANSAPELTQDIPLLETMQNSGDNELIDLRLHFQDDNTADDDLTFTVNYNSNPADVDIFLKNDYFLTINTTRNRLFNGLVGSKVIAEDENGESSLSNNFYIDVLEVPLPPEIIPFPDFNLQEGEVKLTALYVFDHVSDPDTDYEDLVITLVNNTHGANVDVKIVGDVLKIIPLKDYNGDGSVEVSVDDGNFTLVDKFFINITPANDPPELSIDTPANDDKVGNTTHIIGNASDIDGDALTLTMEIGQSTQTHDVDGNFDILLDLSNYLGKSITIKLTLSDGRVEDIVIITLEVMDVSGADTDNDGTPDDLDDDDDNDGVEDGLDDFPLDPAASKDDDNDGFPDTWNPGMNEGNSTTGLELDMFPDNEFEWFDSDNDGVGNNGDSFPMDPAASKDEDLDGSPDQWNTGKEQNDSTTGLHLDSFPLDSAASRDSDGDGYPDEWNQGKTEADSITGLKIDQYPNDPNKNTADDTPDDDDDTDPQENTPKKSDSPGFKMPMVITVMIFGIFLLSYFRKKKMN